MSNIYEEYKSIVDIYTLLWYTVKKEIKSLKINFQTPRFVTSMPQVRHRFVEGKLHKTLIWRKKGMVIKMELRELRYFLAVAREKSITKAAEYLYIAQPSLSKQMQNLEKEIGRPLFIRGSRRITLTETGMLLKKRAEEMLDLYEKTEAELSAPLSDVSGDVYIGGGESHTVQTVATAANALQSDYPNIRFHFFSGDASDVTEKLDNGLIDFGILVGLDDLSKYDVLHLPLTNNWGVLMRRDSPLAEKCCVTPEDLRDAPLICSKQSLNKGTLIYKWFDGNIDNLNIKATYNLLYNASLLVKEGMGYAMGLDNLINTENTELCFKPLSPKVETYLDIAWKKYTVFSKAAELFLIYLKKYCK